MVREICKGLKSAEEGAQVGLKVLESQRVDYRPGEFYEAKNFE